MKAAFGILALYLSIPLAILAAQGVVAHEATPGAVAHQAAMGRSATHATVARTLPAAALVAAR